jgi:hypothetical protein
MNEDRDLRDRIGLEVSYLETIEEEKPAEEGSRGKVLDILTMRINPQMHGYHRSFHP